jgi:hypothetical protein
MLVKPVIYFTRKINMTAFEYKLCGLPINRTDSVKDLGVFLDSELYFYQHVGYIYFFYSYFYIFLSSIDSFLKLYFDLLRSKLEYTSLSWNTFTSTDASKLERIQRKFLTVLV